VTRPPGERFQLPPSAVSTRSTGRRFETTTNEKVRASPLASALFPSALSASALSASALSPSAGVLSASSMSLYPFRELVR